MKPTPWTLCPEVIPWRPSFACRTQPAVNESGQTLEAHKLVTRTGDNDGVKYAQGDSKNCGITLSRMPPGFKAPIVVRGCALMCVGATRVRMPKRPGKYDWRK